jgi:hypothetical protein
LSTFAPARTGAGGNAHVPRRLNSPERARAAEEAVRPDAAAREALARCVRLILAAILLLSFSPASAVAADDFYVSGGGGGNGGYGDGYGGPSTRQGSGRLRDNFRQRIVNGLPQQRQPGPDVRVRRD